MRSFILAAFLIALPAITADAGQPGELVAEPVAQSVLVGEPNVIEVPIQVQRSIQVAGDPIELRIQPRISVVDAPLPTPEPDREVVREVIREVVPVPSPGNGDVGPSPRGLIGRLIQRCRERRQARNGGGNGGYGQQINVYCPDCGQ